MHTEETTTEKTAREIESDFQRECSEFVHREVYCCASSLVHELAKDEKYMDELMEVCSQYQYTHTFSYTCTSEVATGYEDKGGSVEVVECGETWEWEEEPRTEQWDRIQDIDDLEPLVKACPKCDSPTEPTDVSSHETDPIEAYEHWIVSDWLAGKLEAQGEMVLRDFLGLTIWGRTCTGQAISMDHNIRALVKSLA